MASALPPVKGVAFSFEIGLTSQADTNIFKTGVTIAAADVLISKDGGATAQIASVPAEIGTSGLLTVALSATEMNADRVTVLFHDASGAEWQDAVVTIYTAAQTLDTTDGVADGIKTDTAAILLDTGTDGVLLAAAYDAAKTAAQAGDAMTLTNDYDAAKTAAQAGDAMTLADDAITSAKFDESTAFPVTSADAGATQIARTGADSDTLETISDQLDDLLTYSAGSGSKTFVYTVTNSATNAPVPDCLVIVYTDAAMTARVASGYTDAFGQVTFYLDPGTYYLKRVKRGYNATNPDVEVVS